MYFDTSPPLSSRSLATAPALVLNEEDVEYKDLGEDELKAFAEERGCTVEFADDFTIQVDLDDAEKDVPFFKEMLGFAENLGLISPVKETPVEIYPSRSGTGRHAVIKLKEPIDVRERILIQAILGSDRRREMLNYMRVKRGFRNQMPDPVVLFRPKKFLSAFTSKLVESAGISQKDNSDDDLPDLPF